MFRAYSGSHDAYIYGPICVAESERGHGLATALFAELRERLPRIGELNAEIDQRHPMQIRRGLHQLIRDPR
jgi:GNAT superfamily N-acetyltransferase